MTIVACVTTLNEDESVGKLVPVLRHHGLDVIVSDGGSNDGTPYTAAVCGARVLHSDRILPISTALIRAFRIAMALQYGRIAVIDAGGSHDPHDLPRLLSHDADVVIGSRFVPGARYIGRPWRAALSRIAAAACNFAQPGASYRDWTSGYRVYSRRAVEEILRHRYRARMHGWQIEVLARLGEAGMSVVEAPITYRAGRSSFNASTAREAFDVWLHMVNHIGWRRGAEEIA